MTINPIPIISNPFTTTTILYGGDVIVNVSNLLNDIDISPLFDGWRPIIKTQFLFRSGKFAMYDSDSSNEVHLVVDNILNHSGNVNLHIPAFTDADQTLVLDTLPQILENKVMHTGTAFSDDADFDSNSILNAVLENSIIDGDLNTLVDIPNSALTQITDKNKLPNDTVYTSDNQTLTNKTSLDTANTIGTNISYTYTVFISGSNYIAKNNITGVKQSFANTDLAPVVEYCIQNMVSAGSGGHSLYAGGIFIKKGSYNQITQLDATFDLATRHGIVIDGEGDGTVININPSSALTVGILGKMANLKIRNLHIILNANVVNGIKLIGQGVGQRRHDYDQIMDVTIEGPNGNGGQSAGNFVSGQVGIWLDGATPAVFFSWIQRCTFIALDRGIKADGLYATSSFIRDNTFNVCNEAVEMASGQHIIDGAWIQGDTSNGTNGIHLKTGAAWVKIDNIISELHKTATTCATVLIDSGVGNIYIGRNISNAYDDQVNFFTVKDNSGATSNHMPSHIGVRAQRYLSLQNNIVSVKSSFLSLINGQLLLNNPEQNYNIIPKVASGLGATRDATIPALSANDTFLFANQSQIITSKEINSINNTIKNLNVYKYSIFKDGSTYYCRNNITGAIAISNASPNTVIQYVLDNGGDAYIFDADYVLTGSPSVYFEFPKEPLVATLYCGPNVFFVVPQGYTGLVFRFRNDASNHVSYNKLIGGQIKEAGSIARNWTGILLEGIGTTTRGVYNNSIFGVRIHYPNIGIKLNNDATSTNGFVNANFLEKVTIFGAKTAYVDFGMDSAYVLETNGINRNDFKDFTLQSTNGTDASVGFRNIRHNANSFTNCYIADFTGPQINTTIHADASNTLIDLGTMTDTAKGYVDSSLTQSTMVRDPYRRTQINTITPGQSGTNLDITPKGLTNTTSWWDNVKSERMYFSKQQTEYWFDILRQTSGGALKPLIFSMHDVPNTTKVESFRVETDSSLRVYTNKFKLLDSDQSHSYIFSTGNLSVSDRTISIPAITGNDEMVLRDVSQTLALKTLNTNQNTIKDGSANLAGDLLVNNGSKFVRKIRGSAYTVPAMNSTGDDISFNLIDTLNIADNAITDAKVIAHTSTKVTISNKSQLPSSLAYEDEANVFTAQQTININNDNPIKLYKPVNTVSALNGIQFDFQNSSSTQTAYAQIQSSIVSNTAGSESGQINFKTRGSGSLATRLSINHVGNVILGSNQRLVLTESGLTAQRVISVVDRSVVLGDIYEENKQRIIFGELDVQDGRWGSGMYLQIPTAIGNNTGTGNDADGTYRYYGTGTAPNTKTGNRTTNAVFRRAFKPHIFMFFKIYNDNTNCTMFLGLASVSDASELHDTEPLNAMSGIGLAVMSGQANYHIVHNDGTGTSTKVDTLIPKSTAIKSIEIKNANNDANWSIDLNNGEYTTTISTDVPAENTQLFDVWHFMNTDTTDRYFYIHKKIGKMAIP